LPAGRLSNGTPGASTNGIRLDANAQPSQALFAQDGKLMAENQNLNLESRPRFEQRCDKTDDEVYSDHSRPV
jgi:hypothetical protein